MIVHAWKRPLCYGGMSWNSRLTGPWSGRVLFPLVRCGRWQDTKSDCVVRSCDGGRDSKEGEIPGTMELVHGNLL